MPSPFPGMNPYLEQEDVWTDFHQSLLPLIRGILSAQVLPAYVVKVEEHLFIRERAAKDRVLLGRADGAVRPTGLTDQFSPVGAQAAVQAPVYALLPQAVDVERHGYLEIRDRSSREIVTVIGLLSPSNKRPGPDREQYIAKRQRLIAGGTHLVELDLLRGHPRMPMQALPECDYYALVSRAEERPRVGIWPIRLRDRLPVISIPLRAPDPDATLDLQAVLNKLYDEAGYNYYIYQGSPNPALRPEDAAWAEQFVSLQNAGS